MKRIRFSKKQIAVGAVLALLSVAVITLSVLLLTSLSGDSEAEKSYYDIKCESFGVQNANLSYGQIVFVGDSITDLYKLDSYYSDLPLAVYNRGIGGDTTEGVLRRLDVSVFDIEPSCVVLMIGTNDVDGGVENSKIAENYREIVGKIYRELPSVELYCVSVIPQNEVLETYTTLNIEENTEKILLLNEEIKKISTEYGAIYVDLFSRLADSENKLIKEYSDDGLHLNSAGFEVWTATLKPYFEEK